MKPFYFRGPEATDETQKGFKTGSLRKRNLKYDFEPGEVVMGEFPDTGDHIPLTIVRTLAGEVGKLQIQPLSLDGVFEKRQAVGILKEFYGPTETRKSPVNYEVFLTQDRFEKLNDGDKKEMLERGVPQLIADPKFAELFLPGIAHYYFRCRYPDHTMEDYLDWARKKKLVSPKRIEATRGSVDKGTILYLGSSDVSALLDSRDDPEEEKALRIQYSDLILLSPDATDIR